MTINTYKKGIYNDGFKNFVDCNCTYPDFPIKGVNFIDIFPLLERANFEDIKGVGLPEEPIIFVPEARGFLFYGVLGADRCVPLRKPGKLPGQLVSIDYEKEYGKDTVAFQKEALERQLDKILAAGPWLKDEPIPVCYFDDVIATGGSAKAAIEAINNYTLHGYHFKVVNAYFYIELVELGGRKLLEGLTEVNSVYEY